MIVPRSLFPAGGRPRWSPVWPGLFFLLILVSAASCGSRKENLTRVWFFIEREAPEGGEAGEDDALSLSAASFINLEPAGTYTSYFDGFGWGTWTLEGDQLVLLNHRRQKAELTIQKLEGDDLVIRARNRMAYAFEGQGDLPPGDDNPFALANNRWRIKATHKESEAEIKARLRNHFRYWEKYFDWGLQRESTLDVRSLPGPLKIYGNGFQLLPYGEQHPDWQAHFYDTADSRTAYNILYRFFTREDIEWPQTKDRFKQFRSAFRQLQSRIK
ncbi:MAG TPA: hypothetical protein VHK69_12720 [Chitinophagaceae bacterium]|nr:hypothetical protein [Chitinophagaceae bacterium]